MDIHWPGFAPDPLGVGELTVLPDSCWILGVRFTSAKGMGNSGDREGGGKGKKRKLEGLDPLNVSRSASKTPRNSPSSSSKVRMCTSLTAAGGSEKFLANDTHIDNEQRGLYPTRGGDLDSQKNFRRSLYTRSLLSSS